MARWQSQGRRWLLALVSAACATGLTIGRADAQQAGLIYEKQLDLGQNLSRSDEATGDRAPEQDAAYYTHPLSLPALVPGTDVSGERRARIVQGTPARPGAWRSAVNIHSAFAGLDGRQYTATCGATLIDARWALTAAHCVFQAAAGGVRDLRWVTAFADDVRFQKGKALRVKGVYVNREYIEGWIINDVALLELERPTALPRQKLAAAAGQSTFLAPGTMATVVGWGLTKGGVPSSGSPTLLQASLPVASKAVCDAYRQQGGWQKPGRPLTDADFCAGHGSLDKPIICNGDSGGPLLVSGATGEPIQAGVVSWVRGPCLSAYGGFANVGYFEAWIRKHVPDAVFVMPGKGPTSAPLMEIAGGAPGGPPAPFGQCAVDVYANGDARNRIRVGSELTVRVTTGVSGHLAVFSHTSEDKVVQLFPNRQGAGAAGSAAVRAGDVVALPGPADSFALTVSPPHGRYAVTAIVLPEGGGLPGMTRRFADMAPIEGFGNVLAALADDARGLPEDSPRAVCTRQFDVVE